MENTLVHFDTKDTTITWGVFKKKMYAISGKPKNEYKKMHPFMKEYVNKKLQEKNLKAQADIMSEKSQARFFFQLLKEQFLLLMDQKE